LNKVDIEKLFKDQINKIWDDPKYQDIRVIDRGYAVSTGIVKDSILFIGINPSYTTSDSSRSFYELKQKDNEYRKYFSKFEEISKCTKHPWSHIDLLFFKETSQKYIDTIVKDYPEGLSFIWQQLLVTKQILEILRPKIIVVSNTKARQFLGKEQINDRNIWLGYDFKFDQEIGTDKIMNKDSKLFETPVFFTSMLSGQRAMDNGSFERLKWHINRSI